MADNFRDFLKEVKPISKFFFNKDGLSDIEKEKKTIKAMIRMYCNNFHSNNNNLCMDCEELLDYATFRLEKCPFQENKPVCRKCSVHCYKPSMRMKISSVMRYSGPRMLLRHPILALFYLRESRKKQIHFIKRSIKD